MLDHGLMDIKESGSILLRSTKRFESYYSFPRGITHGTKELESNMMKTFSMVSYSHLCQCTCADDSAGIMPELKQVLTQLTSSDVSWTDEEIETRDKKESLKVSEEFYVLPENSNKTIQQFKLSTKTQFGNDLQASPLLQIGKLLYDRLGLNRRFDSDDGTNQHKYNDQFRSKLLDWGNNNNYHATGITTATESWYVKFVDAKKHGQFGITVSFVVFNKENEPDQREILAAVRLYRKFGKLARWIQVCSAEPLEDSLCLVDPKSFCCKIIKIDFPMESLENPITIRRASSGDDVFTVEQDCAVFIDEKKSI